MCLYNNIVAEYIYLVSISQQNLGFFFSFVHVYFLAFFITVIIENYIA